jgi:hypothetical protein
MFLIIVWMTFAFVHTQPCNDSTTLEYIGFHGGGNMCFVDNSTWPGEKTVVHIHQHPRDGDVEHNGNGGTVVFCHKNRTSIIGMDYVTIESTLYRIDHESEIYEFGLWFSVGKRDLHTSYKTSFSVGSWTIEILSYEGSLSSVIQISYSDSYLPISTYLEHVHSDTGFIRHDTFLPYSWNTIVVQVHYKTVKFYWNCQLIGRGDVGPFPLYHIKEVPFVLNTVGVDLSISNLFVHNDTLSISERGQYGLFPNQTFMLDNCKELDIKNVTVILREPCEDPEPSIVTCKQPYINPPDCNIGPSCFGRYYTDWGACGYSGHGWAMSFGLCVNTNECHCKIGFYGPMCKRINMTEIRGYINDLNP